MLRQYISGDLEKDFIKLVQVKPFGVIASLGWNFDNAIFGRDSIRVAEDLLYTHRQLAEEIILTLASLQGLKRDDITEEEPGKIHHEYRALEFGGKQVPAESVKILRDLQKIWGKSSGDEMAYYGSVDSTPLYIELVRSYVFNYGRDILSQIITDRAGSEKAVSQTVKDAVDWLISKLENSAWGLLEYKRSNPNGLQNQVWKDSVTSYLHEDGSLAEFDRGIAAIEVQGYAYDALLAAVDLFPDEPDANKWLEHAKDLRTRTLRDFWIPEYKYFAQALDRDTNGKKRQVKTLTSNPGLLLRTKILQGLENRQPDYIDHVVKMLMSDEFLTEAGIRCRSLRHKDFPGFADYHGSFTTWPKETSEIARGMHLNRYQKYGSILDDSVLDAVLKAGEFYEFFYINDDGSVWYNREDALKLLKAVYGENVDMPFPEAGQAWTISSVMAIIERRKLIA